MTATCAHGAAAWKCSSFLAFWGRLFSGWRTPEVRVDPLVRTPPWTYSLQESLPRWLFEGKVPRPSIAHRRDPAVYAQWLRTIPEPYSALRELIEANFLEISQARLERELFRSFQSFLDITPSDKPILLLVGLKTEEEGPPRIRSSTWTAALLRERFSSPSTKFVFCAYTESNIIDGLPVFDSETLAKIKSGEYRIVVSDDGSYTGSQMGMFAKTFVSLAPKTRLHMVIPFTTSRARELIRIDDSVLLHFSADMPSLREIVAASPRNLRERLSAMPPIPPCRYAPSGLLDDKRGIMFFTHRSADATSLPFFFVSGAELRADGQIVTNDAFLNLIDYRTRAPYREPCARIGERTP